MNTVPPKPPFGKKLHQRLQKKMHFRDPHKTPITIYPSFWSSEKLTVVLKIGVLKIDLQKDEYVKRAGVVLGFF